MGIQTLYNTAQTREAVIRAYQGNTTTIGWVLVGQTGGYVFNPAGSPNHSASSERSERPRSNRRKFAPREGQCWDCDHAGNH